MLENKPMWFKVIVYTLIGLAMLSFAMILHALAIWIDVQIIKSIW